MEETEEDLVLPSLLNSSTDRIDETIEMIAKESHVPPKEIEEAYFIVKEPASPVKDAEKVVTLRAEVANLKVTLIQPSLTGIIFLSYFLSVPRSFIFVTRVTSWASLCAREKNKN